RVARASGRGTLAAAQLGHHLFRRWRDTRRGFEEPPAASSYQAVIRRGASPGPRVAAFPDRREPRLGPVPAAAAPQAAPERMADRLARLVMPRTKPAGPGRRAAQELQPALALDDEPVLPPLALLAKPPTPRTEAVDEEALAKNARMLEAVLEDFGVRGGIVQVRPGPV